VRKPWLVTLLVLIIGSRSARAAPSPDSTLPQKLVVGTHEIAPFVIKHADGTWSGISIDLVRRVASELGVAVEIRGLTLDRMLAADSPDIDITASVNVTVNTDRKWSLSHAFHSTGLAIAVPQAAKASVWDTLGRVFSGTFVLTVVCVLVLLVLAGLAMWWLESRAKEQSKQGKELSRAMYWAFEPVIGYKASQHNSRGGRLLGTLWGLFGLVFVTGLTANLSSRLTIDRLDTNVRSIEDLGTRKIGTVIKSLAERQCERRGLRFESYPDAVAALTALERGEVEAVVYEAPILAYHLRERFTKLKLIPGTFANHGYAFGLRKGAPWRDAFNAALLEVSSSDDFASAMARYIGRAE
jgi:ABC-type amino acid transport substrate-binding protein